MSDISRDDDVTSSERPTSPPGVPGMGRSARRPSPSVAPTPATPEDSLDLPEPVGVERSRRGDDTPVVEFDEDCVVVDVEEDAWPVEHAPESSVPAAERLPVQVIDGLAPGSRRKIGWGVVAASVAAFAVAPWVVPDAYSPISHTVDAAAAQGTYGAWVARIGFVLWGVACLWLADAYRLRWHRQAVGCFAAAGISSIAAAAFGAQAWVVGTSYDPVEHILHLVAVVALVLSMALGMVSVSKRVVERGTLTRLHDVGTAAAVLCLPLTMTGATSLGGVLQRGILLLAALWVARQFADA